MMGQESPLHSNRPPAKVLDWEIVGALVKQIGGNLEIAAGDSGRGARFTITFCSPIPVMNRT
jgi:hypothetical protein